MGGERERERERGRGRGRERKFGINTTTTTTLQNGVCTALPTTAPPPKTTTPPSRTTTEATGPTTTPLELTTMATATTVTVGTGVPGDPAAGLGKLAVQLCLCMEGERVRKRERFTKFGDCASIRVDCNKMYDKICKVFV